MDSLRAIRPTRGHIESSLAGDDRSLPRIAEASNRPCRPTHVEVVLALEVDLGFRSRPERPRRPNQFPTRDTVPVNPTASWIPSGETASKEAPPDALANRPVPPTNA